MQMINNNKALPLRKISNVKSKDLKDFVQAIYYFLISCQLIYLNKNLINLFYDN